AAVERHRRVGAGALPRGGETGGDQVGVRARNGIARNLERFGDGSFAGQPRAERNAAVADQFLNGLAQAAIRRCAAEWSDEGAEALRRQGAIHEAIIARLDLSGRSNWRKHGAMNAQLRPYLLSNLGPVAQLRAGRLPERLLRLLIGLWLYGVAIALMIEGALGASPWDVFHLGVSRHVPVSFGVVMILAALGVLLAWIPLRQMPGLGTVANTLLLGPFADLNLALIDTPQTLPLRCLYLVGGVVVCAFATALYVGAQLGPGPRDGLMTGLVRRTGWSIRRVRTIIEVGVLVIGVLLGGAVGIGTIVFAVGVGPVTQFFLRYLVVPLEVPVGELSREA
ncbi:MAG TPA: hypothetical protein VN153_10270, partial [Tahibacter sp.]|nr:hypothetical protein [Tahibacter sp.]